MSSKLARFAKVASALAAAVALASPTLVSAEPHGSDGGGHVAHFDARGRDSASDHAYVAPRYRGYAGGARAFAGRAYAGRGYAGAQRWGYRVGWGGGWWNGYYWPAAYYGWAYPWFLAALPLGYATYWWGGVPYYYVNDVYYSWNPTDNGYVVTDPPPVAGENALPADPTDSGQDYSPPPAEAPPSGPPPASAAPRSGSPDDLYMYPRNGQSAQQQSTDRYECHKWAQQQTGFDSTQQASQSSGNAYDYHRAMVACLDGRGYSVN